MSFDTTLYVRDVEGSLVAVRGGHGGQMFAGSYTLRDATTTGNASLTNGTVTSLRAGVAGRFLDLAQITMANTSTAANSGATIEITDDSTTVRTLRAANNQTTSVIFDPPIPQGAKGSAWRADMNDLSNTTVNVGALFLINR